MITLYGKPTSINVRKVRWTCAELQVVCQHEQSEISQEQLFALNPNGTVPVVQDGDLVLWESNTIIKYLAGAYGGEQFLPNDPGARASIEKWIDWQASELNPAWSYAFQALVRKNPADPDKERIEKSLENWAEKMDLLEGQLSKTKGFVAGSDFSLADIPIGLSVNRWFMTPGTERRHPAVSAYYDRLAQRPAYLEFGRNGAP